MGSPTSERSFGPKADSHVNRLTWDSDFFGFGIGEVDLRGMDEAGLAAADDQAREAGLRCLVARLDSAEVHLSALVQERGYQLVELATTFDLQPDEPLIPAPEGIDIVTATSADVPRLTELALLMARWSRFAADPRFGIEAAKRMQLAWLERSARNDDGVHSLLIAERDGEAISFIGHVAGSPPRVDAVGTTARGSGAARYLIQCARDGAGDQPLLGGPIAARNVPALRYVSHCGYRVASVDYVFHRWLDVPSDGA